jgi:glycerol-3-phosphate acyltransferase PlsY
MLLGYFLGSIPTAYIAGHILKAIDIRQLGDTNMGAANVFRQLSPKAGIVVGLVDAGKGSLAILIAQAANIPQVSILFTGVAAIVGHNWPIFISFRGGRGVSTTIGVLITVITQPMLIVGGPAVLALLIKRNVTLACTLLFIPLPLVCWWLGTPGIMVTYSIALPGLVGFTHFLRTRRKVMRQV